MDFNKAIEEMITKKLQNFSIASKGYVQESITRMHSGRIVTLEKQVKRLFAEIDRLKNELEFKEDVKPLTKEIESPRIGQLCYVWNNYDEKNRSIDFKSSAKFDHFNNNNKFVDIDKYPWDRWSFIPVEDIQ